MASMETFHGHVRTQLDAIILFEACRMGIIPRIRRRLSERERLQIKSGNIYVWDEGEAGMRRWTDGKSWSASRVSGSFLTYREMDGNRRGLPEDKPDRNRKRKNSDSHGRRQSSGASPEDTPTDSEDSKSDEGCRYKKGGLYKQSFSLTTSSNLKLHLIAYYTKEDLPHLVQPSLDERLKSLSISLEMYPDTSSLGSSLIPAITTVPMYGKPSYIQPHQPLAQPQGHMPPHNQHILPSPPPMYHHLQYNYPPHPHYPPPMEMPQHLPNSQLPRYPPPPNEYSSAYPHPPNHYYNSRPLPLPLPQGPRTHSASSSVNSTSPVLPSLSSLQSQDPKPETFKLPSPSSLTSRNSSPATAASSLASLCQVASNASPLVADTHPCAALSLTSLCHATPSSKDIKTESLPSTESIITPPPSITGPLGSPVSGKVGSN